jgi:hypothetical protein
MYLAEPLKETIQYGSKIWSQCIQQAQSGHIYYEINLIYVDPQESNFGETKNWVAHPILCVITMWSKYVGWIKSKLHSKCMLSCNSEPHGEHIGRNILPVLTIRAQWSMIAQEIQIYNVFGNVITMCPLGTL